MAYVPKAVRIYPLTKICQQCGVEFTPVPTKRKLAKTCSKKCSYLLRSKIMKEVLAKKKQEKQEKKLGTAALQEMMQAAWKI